MSQATMRAAVLVEPRHFEVIDAPVPEPAAGEVRLRLAGTGVCASNLPPFEGREWFSYPMEPGALGHEGWGEIDALGDGVEGFAVGDRVAALSQHAYAEYDTVAADAVVKLPASLADQPFPAEPLGCAVNVFARSGVQPGQTVAVVGIGFLGALLVRLAKHAGANVIALSRRATALAAAQAMGADHTLALDERWRNVEQVQALTDGRLCEVVIEAVGKQPALDLASDLCAEYGRLIIAGYHQDGLRTVNLQEWNWRCLDVINAHERDPAKYTEGMSRAVDLVDQGILDPRPLLTHKFGLDQLEQSLTMTDTRPEGFLKAIIQL